jgi:Fe-S oxidoreductase
MRLASLVPALYNCAVTAPGVSRWIKRLAGFSPQRSLPTLHATTLVRWHAKHANPPNLTYLNGRVFLFCDEFTNFNDTPMGIKAVQLLNRLGYEVVIPEHVESGRAHFSKGLIRDAQQFAIRNVELLKDLVSAKFPLVGLEPSCILSFRDEYPDLMPDHLLDAAKALAQNALLIDEFVAREADAGRITKASFKAEPRLIKLHGHCHQKALSSLTPTVKMLELPAGHKVSVIASGCCGMAGSFGYEDEHFQVSQQIGELVLFPAVRAAPADTLIAAPGTSCRHQLKDATGRVALHPVEILHAALL